MDTKIKQSNNYVVSEFDDDSPFVDVRAFHMDRFQGQIDAEELYRATRSILECPS